MAKKSNPRKHTSQTLPTPQRQTEAFQPQMRDRYRSLRHEVFRRLMPGVLGQNQNFFDSHRFDLREVEDLRHAQKGNLHKGRYLRIDGAPARYGYQQVPLYSRLWRMREVLQLRFFEPGQTVVCYRRKTRRRVLFALQKVGRQGIGNRRAHWSAASYIRCK